MANRYLVSKSLRRILDRSEKPPGWLLSLINRRREQQARWRPPGSPFNLGQKQIYLPSFTVALLRNRFLGPNYAQFKVPLSFNKFDLRDYLWHAYNVRVHSVRSYVQQHPIQPVERSSWRDLPGKRKHFRPKSTKKMIVELDRPFIWPDAPEDFGTWDNKRYKKFIKSRKESVYPSSLATEKQQDIESHWAQRAAKLLAGKETWQGGDSGEPAAVDAGSKSSSVRELPLRSR